MTTFSSASFTCSTCDGTGVGPGVVTRTGTFPGTSIPIPCHDCEGGRIPVPTTEDATHDWPDDGPGGPCKRCGQDWAEYLRHQGSHRNGYKKDWSFTGHSCTRPASWALILPGDRVQTDDGPGMVTEIDIDPHFACLIVWDEPVGNIGHAHYAVPSAYPHADGPWLNEIELDLDHVNPARLAHPAWTPPYPKGDA